MFRSPPTVHPKREGLECRNRRRYDAPASDRVPLDGLKTRQKAFPRLAATWTAADEKSATLLNVSAQERIEISGQTQAAQ
jgi:hypothetical protein